MVYASRFGSRAATIVLKYLVQWRRTLRILQTERPDVVFVMTPPVFAALPAFWYAWRHGKQVVVDAHTAAFLLPRWKWFQGLQGLLCRRAVTTLVSNTYLAGLVRQRGGHATVVPDVPVIFERSDRFQRPKGFTVAAVCSFDYDEPVDAIFEAASRLPEVTFYVTGNPSKLSADVRGRLTPNVNLTGFLRTEVFGSLLAQADVALVLTTYDHTMLRGAYEAIYQGTPVIVSDWPLLREAFAMGSIHVDNTPRDIVEAIYRAESSIEELRAEACRLRQQKLARWECTKQELLLHIGAAVECAVPVLQGHDRVSNNPGGAR
jgi:glycosyltransferase involved in cell wall biosynthesis